MKEIFNSLSALILVLISIPPIIWVISVSFLGQAIKIAQEELKKKEQDNKKRLEQLRKAATDKLQSAQTKGEDQIKEAKRLLDERDKEIDQFRKDTKRTRRRYSYLTVTQGIIIPFGLFLVALIIVWLRPYYQGNVISLSLVLASISLLIIAGICQIYLIIKLIEDMVQRTRPILELGFKTTPLPEIFQLSEFVIEFTVALKQTEVARNITAMFFVPKGFDYLNERNKWKQDKGFNIPEALSASRFWNIILPTTSLVGGIVIKAPAKTGEYTLGYNLECEGFDSGFKEFKVIVKQTDLEIIEAIYGTLPNKIIDITKKAKNAITNGRVSFSMDNTFAGNDPDKGVLKKGIIEYRYKDKMETKEYKEHDVVNLPG